MKVSKSKLGLESYDGVFILNVKCEPLLVDFMTRSDGFFHGYHMNKNNRLTILLDGTVDTDTVFEFIDKSYSEISGNANGNVRKEKKHA